MLQRKLSDLRDFILLNNKYFDSGYDNVTQDGKTGIINNGDVAVFPSDSSGNFFYLRLPNQLGADYSSQFDIADNHQSIGVKYDVILVACVNGADASLLLENLITTIGRYNKEQLKITKMIVQPEVVLMQELSKIPGADVDAALSRIPEDMAFASVHFTFTIPFVFQNLNCIQSPCKSC